MGHEDANLDGVNARFVGRRQEVLSPSQRDDEGVSRFLSHLSNTVNTIEDRLLHLIRESAQGAVALEDFISELSLLRKDLERCYRQIADMQGRRDISFNTLAALGELDQRCVWLYRKIHLEQAFFKKLHLEGKLRGLISAEAYEVYQELLNVEEHEANALENDGPRIRRLLLKEDTCLLPS